jgi:hypothetical protein
MSCHWTPLDEPDDRGWRRWRCTICGRQTNPTPHGPEMIHATCAGRGWRHWSVWRIGNVVAVGLAFIGVTEERLKAWGWHDCNCGNRRDSLNRFGLRLRGRLIWLLG